MADVKVTAHVFCPDENGHIEGEPMWEAMALPFHLIGKTCKKCGKPVAEHGFRIGDKK